MTILLTGSSSMVGKAIVRCNEKYDIVRDDHKFFDLTDYDRVVELFKTTQPKYVIHLASLNGNISFNNKYPSDIFYTTSAIGMNVLRACQQFKVEKVVSAISSCAYPDGEDLLIEKNFWGGEPHRSVDAHGFSKRFILEYGRQLYKQYGMISVGVCFNTCYGPHDNFDLNKTKVMGSLIKKICDAKKQQDKSIYIWGTGNPRREFIYVDDVARMIFETIDKYSDPFYPINIGSGEDVSISELAKIIKDIVGYKGTLNFDLSKPDGQMKKLLSNQKMKKYFGSQEFVPLNIGIERTVDWYESNYSGS